MDTFYTENPRLVVIGGKRGGGALSCFHLCALRGEVPCRFNFVPCASMDGAPLVPGAVVEGLGGNSYITATPGSLAGNGSSSSSSSTSSSSSSSTPSGGGGGGGGDDEVREQDRYLPVANIARIMKVRGCAESLVLLTCRRFWSHPILFVVLSSMRAASTSAKREDCEGCKGVRARVRQRIHIIHHVRGFGSVSAGKAQDDQRRRLAMGHGHAGVRRL